jgi:hypothetical protein
MKQLDTHSIHKNPGRYAFLGCIIKYRKLMPTIAIIKVYTVDIIGRYCASVSPLITKVRAIETAKGTAVPNIQNVTSPARKKSLQIMSGSQTALKTTGRLLFNAELIVQSTGKHTRTSLWDNTD